MGVVRRGWIVKGGRESKVPFPKQYCCQKYFRQKYFHQKYFCQNYLWKNIQIIFEKKMFCQKYFRKNTFDNNISELLPAILVISHRCMGSDHNILFRVILLVLMAGDGLSWQYSNESWSIIFLALPLLRQTNKQHAKGLFFTLPLVL